ncbi:MAG: GCN5-related N-acetyltransferase [Sporomusa sp.]|jgi:GNAT superfamily N-acetyltransferase|nr:GCN5-related N-acetyltransferase [Sporomusa sp.]
MSENIINTNSDACEMTVMPCIITKSTRTATITLENEYVTNNYTVDLFTRPAYLLNSIRLDALNRSITIINKPLSHNYDSQITTFKSSYTPLLYFLKNDAFIFEKIGNTCTSLFFDQETSALVGFCSTKCSSLKVKGDSILSLCPAIEIAALCIDDSYRFQGIGQSILRHVLYQITTIKNVVGVQLVTLFAVPNAVDFYKKFGFKKLGAAGKVLYTSSHLRCVPMYIKLPQNEVI